MAAERTVDAYVAALPEPPGETLTAGSGCPDSDQVNLAVPRVLVPEGTPWLCVALELDQP